MDANRAVQMLFRMLMRPLINLGINYLARRGKPEADMTPEEKLQAKRARELARHAEKAAKLTRRLRR
jgi:hypothetical protein